MPEGGGEGWIDRFGRHEGGQPGIDHRQPGVLAHPAVAGQRRQAVGDGLGAALRVGGCKRRRRVEHLLLGTAHGGEQAEVVAQRMALGQASETLGAQGEQVARRQLEKRGLAGSGGDLAGLENGA
ncbi:hypothetical protein D3C81_1650800 [compost metagenome]